jgi:hypothetical protein
MFSDIKCIRLDIKKGEYGVVKQYFVVTKSLKEIRLVLIPDKLNAKCFELFDSIKKINQAVIFDGFETDDIDKIN